MMMTMMTTTARLGATWLMLSATAAILVPSLVTSYSTGAPGKDCWTDRPLHGNFLPAHDIPPYEILVTKTNAKMDPDTYSPGEIINVTIRSRDGTPFKGFLMKVYSSNGVSRGIWGALRTKQHVLKNCGVTHNNSTLETQTSIMWVAPKVPVMDNIQFKAIVVKDYTTFYNNILSRPLKPDYPSLSFDKLFRRLVAFANMNFNVSVASNDLPDLNVKTESGSTSRPATLPASGTVQKPTTSTSGTEVPQVTETVSLPVSASPAPGVTEPQIA